MWIYCSITKLSKVFTDGWKKNYLDMIVRTHRKCWYSSSPCTMLLSGIVWFITQMDQLSSCDIKLRSDAYSKLNFWN